MVLLSLFISFHATLIDRGLAFEQLLRPSGVLSDLRLGCVLRQVVLLVEMGLRVLKVAVRRGVNHLAAYVIFRLFIETAFDPART